MNPAIIFDLGKVLVDFDYTIAARKIAEMEMPILVDRHLRSRAAYRQLGRNNRRRRHAARQKQTSQTEPD